MQANGLKAVNETNDRYSLLLALELFTQIVKGSLNFFTVNYTDN